MNNLLQWVDLPEVHQKIVGDYDGPYSLGVTDDGFLLRVPGQNVAMRFPATVNIQGVEVPVLVKGDFLPPVPLLSATERWIVSFSSGKVQTFDEWEPLRKFLFYDEVDMEDYPVDVELVLMEDGKPRWTFGEVELSAFQAIYTHGLVDGRNENPKLRLHNEHPPITP